MASLRGPAAAVIGLLACQRGAAPTQPAQSSLPTKLQTALERHGDMVVKEYHPIGVFAGQLETRIKLEAVVVSGVWDSTKTVGLRIEAGEAGSGTNAETGVLDADEAGALLKASDDIVKRAPAMSRDSLDYTEVIYTSRGGVELGFYQTGRSQTAFLRAQKSSHGIAFFSTSDFPKLRDLIAAGVEKVNRLNAKTAT